MSTKTLITAAEFLAHASDVPCELVCGEIIEMSPPGIRHGIVCMSVAFLLKQWAGMGKGAKGIVASNDAGVVTQQDPDTVRGPDCLFLSANRIPPGLPLQGFLTIPPDLAVEVLSPGDRWPEVISKVGEYLEAGVREVWVVNPERQEVQVFRPDNPPATLGRSDELKSETVLPGFRCTVSEIFADL